MNSPEEKANELLNKIEGALDGSLPTGGEPYLKETIAIGLICVDEIIAAVPCEPHEGYWEILSDRTDDAIEYWQKVKDCISKL